MQSALHWSRVRRLFSHALRSSFHFAVATVNADGSPQVTPIGSLVLRAAPGRAFFFERFTRGLPANLDRDPRVCLLSVNTSACFWLKSCLAGTFVELPAVRQLKRAVGRPRSATLEELALWNRRVSRARRLKGYALLWASLTGSANSSSTSSNPSGLGR